MSIIESKIKPWLSQVRIPQPVDKVFKDECQFSFNNPLSPGGLYINLNTHQAYGEDYVNLDYKRNNNHLYLHEQWTKVPLSEEEIKKLEKEPEKLAIGCEGGFQLDKSKTKIEKSYKLVILPEMNEIPYPFTEDMPLVLTEAIEAIKEHESADLKEKTAMWDGEDKFISKYANDLEQLPATKKIPSNPKLWKCEESGATENLWLNLATGFIGSGRRQFGSGGNGAALRHYEALGSKYPLVVKLGTITPRGADVYSYAKDEDCLVIDPHLQKHLRHWGINMMDMEKTEKTMTELNVEYNLRYEFNKITEAGSTLKAVCGPEHIGLINLGNTCYMNAILQLFWSIEEMEYKYIAEAMNIFKNASELPKNDVLVEIAKIGFALRKGITGKDQNFDDVLGQNKIDTDIWSVRPFSFKALFGKGHVDFSTGQMQDASEYFLHFLSVIDKAEKTPKAALCFPYLALTETCFSFNYETRLQCIGDKKVSYRSQKQLMMYLNIPMESVTNKDEVLEYEEREMKRQKLKEDNNDLGEVTNGKKKNTDDINSIKEDSKEVLEKILPNVPFEACLGKLFNEETIENVYSESLEKNTKAIKTTRFSNFPPFLMIKLNRYMIDKSLRPKKIEATVNMPLKLDLEVYRSMGPQDGEEVVNADDLMKSGDSNDGIQADPQIVSQLMAMGFGEHGCQKAAIETNNVSADAAMNWVLQHMEDPDFNEPIKKNDKQELDEKIVEITNMGFSSDSARAALIKNGNSVQDAINWILANQSNLDDEVEEILNDEKEKADIGKMRDGKGVYELVGFISHMGSNTACGHYVCHIFKNDRWVIFNDEKVALSETPPIGYGYMYMYRRVDDKEKLFEN